MSKQKAEKQIPTSKRPAMSITDLSGQAKSEEKDDFPDLSVSVEESKGERQPDEQAEKQVEQQASEETPSVGIPEEAILFIYEPKCLGCGHLVAFAEKKHTGCHFTAGNDECPAQSVTISVKLPMTNIIRNFLHAEESGDTQKLGHLYQKLAKKPAWAQRQILEALQEARERALAK